ncbi:MotA/TolQ/ExbB proton channel family protein [bacterium]
MVSGQSFYSFFNMGGITMYILLICSILSIAVIINRVLYFKKKTRIKRGEFVAGVKGFHARNDMEKAIEYSRNTYSLFSNLVHAGLKLKGRTEKEISNALEREITIETIELEKYISVVGTIGTISVYIGLFGTVLGIMKAFHNVSITGAGGISVVIGGVAQALITTAAGLFIAVPAVIAYNYFVKRIDNYVREMELCASEITDLMSINK